MSNDDARLAELLQSLDPARTAETGPLTDQELKQMRAIMAAAPAAPAASAARRGDSHRGEKRALWSIRPRGWRLGLVSIAAVASLIVSVFLVFPVGESPSAVAYAPPTLEYQATDMSAAEVLRLLRSRLAQHDGPEQALRESRSTGWYLSYEVDSDEGQLAIVPQVATLDWNEDRSGRFTLLAGDAYPGHGFTGDIAGEVPRPGTVIDDQVFAAGEFDVPVSVELTANSETALWQEMLAYGMPEKPTSIDLIEGIKSLMEVWTLTDAQQGALLSLLLDRTDAVVVGFTVDRVGREVIGISGKSDIGSQQTLLFSSQTGRLVGAERVLTEARQAIPAGTMASYTIWEEPE